MLDKKKSKPRRKRKRLVLLVDLKS